MSGLKVLWHASAPKTYKRVLFRFNEGRQWRFRENWKCWLSTHHKINFWHWCVITPFLRFTKCNGKVELGLGNHFFEFGW